MWRRVEERVASFAFREAYSFPFVVLVLRDERRKISKSHHNLLKISIFSFFLFLILFVCISFLFLFLFVCFFYSLNYRLGQRERVCVCVCERDSSRCREHLGAETFALVVSRRRCPPAFVVIGQRWQRRGVPRCAASGGYPLRDGGCWSAATPSLVFVVGRARLRGALLPLRFVRAAAVFLIARARRPCAQSRHTPVELAVHETGIRVPMHQRVDLQLGFVEGVRRRLHHVTIHYFAHSRVQAHLKVIRSMLKEFRTLFYYYST